MSVTSWTPTLISNGADRTGYWLLVLVNLTFNVILDVLEFSYLYALVHITLASTPLEVTVTWLLVKL